MDIFQGVKEVLEGQGVDSNAIRPGANLVMELEMDSLEMAEFATELEDKFSITLPSDVMANVLTVGDAVDTVRKLTEKTS